MRSSHQFPVCAVNDPAPLLPAILWHSRSTHYSHVVFGMRWQPRRTHAQEAVLRKERRILRNVPPLYWAARVCLENRFSLIFKYLIFMRDAFRRLYSTESGQGNQRIRFWLSSGE